MQRIKYSVKYLLWVLSGYFGRTVYLESPQQQITILITYFNPLRMNNIDHQVRNLLKCSFVKKVILSNHNPDVNIGTMLHANDQRVITMEQDVKRACGYRWQVARKLGAEYLVVIDDDILLFPKQLKTICEHLFLKPEVPHGSSGMIHQRDGAFQYREREEMEVDYLCEVYAVTHAHVERYFEIEATLAKEDDSLPDAIERLGDYIVISQTGHQNPEIHDVGKLLRSKTFKMPGVANHKDQEFDLVLDRVSQAVRKIHSRSQSDILV